MLGFPSVSLMWEGSHRIIAWITVDWIIKLLPNLSWWMFGISKWKINSLTNAYRLLRCYTIYFHITVWFFSDCKPIIVLVCVSHLVQWIKKRVEGILNCWSHSLKLEIDQNSQGIFFHGVTWLLATILVPVLETVHVTFFICLWKSSCGL